MLYRDVVLRAAGLQQQGKHAEAQALYNALLGQNPDDAFVLYLLGTSWLEQGQNGIAIQLLRRAVDIKPDIPEAWHNLGTGLKLEEHVEAARACYLKRLELDPNPDTMAQVAGTYVNEGNPRPGIEWARKALSLDPNGPHARNHLALCLLEAGEHEEGFREYERRWEVPARAKDARDYGSIPKWDGSPVHRLAIHGEQGIGDEILFLSCLRPVCDELVIEASPRLVPLLRRSFNCEVYPDHATLMQHPRPDAWLPMGDLPRLAHPHHGRYLYADRNRIGYWRQRLEAAGPGPYIACAWGGGLRQTHQAHRCTRLVDWKPLLRHGTFVSVHYQAEAAEEALVAGIHHWPEAIGDIDEMAALIAACDMTVTVCQTAVHLSGALGKPTWVLTPAAPAWRYGLTGEAMRWYPSARLFRQTRGEPWSDVINRMEPELAAHLGSLSGAERRAA